MPLDRRSFLELSLGAALGTRISGASGRAAADLPAQPLRSPRYDQVQLAPSPAKDQQAIAQAVLATLDPDALLKPIRAMGGLPSPGRNLGGWYEYLPTYDWHTGDAGFAPAHAFGQWTSAMARFAAAGKDTRAAEHVLSLQQSLAASITPAFFAKHRFPAYLLDKFNCGLMDARGLLNSSDAFPIAGKVRQCALPSLPGHAIEQHIPWRPGHLDDESYTWDESYTLSENLYLLYTLGAGDDFRAMARQYLFNSYYEPLSRGENVLGGLHAYSHVNSLCSAMQAWFVDRSRMHLDAARNAFQMLLAQSYATGGWGPDETLQKPGSGKLLASLTGSHASFETPCGTYAFLKLSRYLLQATRDGQYGDHAERLLWNAMFGALPLRPDGSSFYYADFSDTAKRVYSKHIWPCCAGTYPQVAADFGINTWQLGPAGEGGVWVNLYLPSTLDWTERGTHLRLSQQGGYPGSERVSMRLESDRPTPFTLHLRVPAWCRSASLKVNGTPASLQAQNGFASISRIWKSGDRLDLVLPASLRLEPFPANGGNPHDDLVALCWGPWVLMPLDPSPTARAEDLLKAERTGDSEWRVRRPNGDLILRPFFATGEDTYATYIRLV